MNDFISIILYENKEYELQNCLNTGHFIQECGQFKKGKTEYKYEN